MSSLTSGQTLRTRAKSRVSSGKVGYVTPDVLVQYHSNGAAPGAVGQFIFTAPAKCRIVAMREVHDVAGAAASKIFLRKHVSGQVAAANAAVSGSNIVDLVTGGIAADSTARAPQTPTVLSTVASLNAGDKLSLVTPITWVGAIDLYLHWTV